MHITVSKNDCLASTCFLIPNDAILTNRMIVGSNTECQYHLLSFGIHPSTLLDCNGNNRRDVVDNYINSLRSRDSGRSQIRKQAQCQVATLPTTSPNLLPTTIPATDNSYCVSKSFNLVSPSDTSNRLHPKVSSVNFGRAFDKKLDVVGTTNGSTNDSLIPEELRAMVAKTLIVMEEQITDHDVLLGRGVPIQTHKGNLFLAKLIDENAKSHKEGSRFKKTVITWDILKKIKVDYGGRFLEKIENNGFTSVTHWKEVDDLTARAKIAYGFRTLAKIQRTKEFRQRTNKQAIGN